MENLVERKVVEQLQEALGEKYVLTGDGIGADYCHDEYPGSFYTPAAVVEATSTQSIALTLKLCNENQVPVTIRGAGTGQVGGSVPIEGGIVLSLKGMNKILNIDEAQRSICVQPGVLLQDLKAAASSCGLYYPPDPGEPTATIGGNAATNAGGPCAVKYGSTCDYILKATLVLADGRIVSLEDEAQYKQVMGAEGALAVIAELSLKLIEKPAADAILLFPFLDSESCLKAALSVMESPFRPAVIEYMDTDIVEFAGSVTGNPVFPVSMDGERVGATLMVTLEAEDDDAVMEMMEAFAEQAEDLECLDILVGDTSTMKKEFWAAHDAFHSSMESGAKNAFEYNISLPCGQIAQMLSYAKTLGAEKGLKVMSYAHVGSGGVHIHAVSDCDKEAFKASIADFSVAIYAKCLELGGDIRGEYGIGYAKKAYLPAQERESFAALKGKFDPNGILNKGKVVD